jgi:3-isopropylmalate dehydratase small subunit
MGLTMLEKILINHSDRRSTVPGQIIDLFIDARVARDFGGANVISNLMDHELPVDDPSCTFFTFDCNPTGSDQKYAENQHKCRIFARENGIKVYDINRGIGTHLLMEEGLAYPGSTAVSTDSHANILGAIGALGLGMGDRDIASAWARGKVWFKVPESVKINITGRFPGNIYSKDIVLNLLARFGASKLLGLSVELSGDSLEELSLDDRITIASMATEMGAVTILIPPGAEVIRYCESRMCRKIDPVFPDHDARYCEVYELKAGEFVPMVSRPGNPHDAIPVSEVSGIKIDSCFIGSCTNGRMQDMRVAAGILKGRRVAPGVVLKIVPSTDKIWNICLEEGLMDIFKEARALVSNPGCAGCASGQVGQNGPGEVTISSGNRNFPGKQGKGDMYLASPAVIAASAVAGYLTTPEMIPDEPRVFEQVKKQVPRKARPTPKSHQDRSVILTGCARVVPFDNIDTDMIYHNRYLTVTDQKEMGEYAFSNLPGYEDFPEKADRGDILVSGKNFGSGSSRQQAVDCFIALGIQCIIAGSFGAIYERNAINAALPVMVCTQIGDLQINDGDMLAVDLLSGMITNKTCDRSVQAQPFSEIQMDIYQNGGLF